MIELFEKLVSVLREGTLPVMLPLILVCIGIGVMILERCLYLYDPRMILFWWFPPVRNKLGKQRKEVTHRLEEFVNHPHAQHRDDLVRACNNYEIPYTRFVSQTVTSLRPVDDDHIRELRVQKILRQEEAAIERGFPILSMFARAAPLLGLLGTVTGMIQTFSAMMVASTSDPKALSSGISIALIATNVGLVVSLPGVIGNGMLSRRAKSQQEQIRLASMRIREMVPFWEGETPHARTT